MTPSPVVRPESEIDFTDADINRDPYPWLERVRAVGRAVWNPPSNSWFITSFDDVKAVFSNFADFAQEAEMFEAIFNGPTMVSLDDPRHAELRSVLSSQLSRRAVAGHVELARETINDNFDPIIERLRAGETVDFAPAFRSIPTEFVARLLGVPTEDRSQFIHWAERMTGVYELKLDPGMDGAAAKQQSAAQATQDLYAYSAAAIAERERSGGGDDLLTTLASTDVALTEQEKCSYITMLIFGAQDTTETFAKNATATFALHPDQRRAVHQDRALLRPALEEVMRWQAPVFAEMRRVRHAHVEIDGVRLGQGDNVSLLLGAAHRDPSRWDDPNTFDISRPEKGNLGFGFGLHSCLGVNLARLELQTIFNKLLDEVPEYQLAIPANELDYGTFFSVRGPKHLPIQL
ncbi:cytochrome P450 [Mycobacterium sp. CBMA293]|uniref:cytochrome P450 n=1 Tax=unclassified Mycolicibacterium TaxID=2636767 RepID=UPI0012DEE5C6|nr:MULTISPECIES: cytochrome P450 [unclassified Mycolicibacterium]MUL50151.1 cytochrome P450 [Mycolicibacterium sp. CBMA 360]MUL62814.1 cytochrome P450 [Mycolicibacterium sp. CBMA 335]MUL68919.1 cytochrome P450 [Mycolicibacterium sp. CBMA 311]MUL97455.1 cytochrome P450 [Mycolicibacterium sp. CBMA 230]MUM15302.1 cytochrome P450 [Mycolicibacterium sp. CBMA 293]